MLHTLAFWFTTDMAGLPVWFWSLLGCLGMVIYGFCIIWHDDMPEWANR